jgi:MEMO1 family protein
MESIGPIVAGTFYPAHPDRLRSDVEGLLAAAVAERVDDLRGIVVPHAGYAYSGPVAATAYALLEAGAFGRVVLIGPSHFVPFDGLATPPAGWWRVPTGDMPIEAADGVPSFAAPFLTEHSLEVQLPFLLARLGSVPVVPLLTGDADPADAVQDLDRLVDGDTLLVVSTDLSHYLPYEAARQIDATTADAIVAQRTSAIGWESACGRTGLLGAMDLARRRAWRIRLLDLRNSGDTAGDRLRVVGYGAFAMSGPA